MEVALLQIEMVIDNQPLGYLLILVRCQWQNILILYFSEGQQQIVVEIQEKKCDFMGMVK